VLAAAAGASRTQGAYPRFLTASKASDVLVAPYFSGPPGHFGALTRLAGVHGRRRPPSGHLPRCHAT
jgi:hypothetical protein